MALVLENEEKDRQQILRPMVTYEGVKFPIYLEDSSQIQLSVEQDEGNPVVRVEKNGTVHALREGKGVIECSSAWEFVCKIPFERAGGWLMRELPIGRFRVWERGGC
jgi:hypothetical protein